MKHLKIILLLLAIFGGSNLYAQLQGQAKIDSLLKELPRQKEDTNKVKVLDGLSWGYADINPVDGLKYGRQEITLAIKLGWKKGIASANNTLGQNYMAKSDYPKALECMQNALMTKEEIGDKQGIALCTGNIGNVYTAQANYPKALEYYQKALKTVEELGNKNYTALFTGNIGTVYSNLGNNPKTLEYYFKALKIYEDLGDKRSIALATGNIGTVYSAQSDYAEALKYYFKALKMNEELGRKNGIMIITGNIGNVYEKQTDYHKALEYHFKALKLADELGNKGSIASVTGSIGNDYFDQNDYPKALEHFFKQLKINEEIGNKKGTVIAVGNIGEAYEKQKNYLMAIEYMQKALKMAEEIGHKKSIAFNLGNIGECFLLFIRDTATTTVKVTSPTDLPANKYQFTNAIPVGKTAILRSAIEYIQRSLTMAKELHYMELVKDDYEHLAEAYKLRGDYKKAMEFGDSSKIIKDSIFSQKNREKIAKLEDGRKAYGDSLKAVAEKQTADIKAAHRRNYELIGGGVIVLLLGFAFFITRNRNLLSKEKQQSETLLHNILPEEVAAQLKDTGKSAARQFDNVSVMFTDFVNFTEASERMKPEVLIEELDTCFKAFDEITTKYNIEKIKTIGDAYLAVCGLPTADPLHAENVIKAAIEIVGFMENRLSKLGSDRTFAVRIGIHSGSVVAGIVGVKKFAYDIWGDTVNTAARMEQNSEAGKINISETTYELVKDKFSCEYRGEVEAKGKGVMKMYFVS